MSCLKVCVLRSSSKGNCTAIWTTGSGILIDCAGLGVPEIARELRDIELDPSWIGGIVITHGHEDHISKNTFAIARHYGIPIYIHPDTYDVIQERYGVIKHSCKIVHHAEKPFSIKDLTVTPFETFHSGGYVGKPFGFRIEHTHKGSCRKVGLVTDTSKVTESMIKMLYDCACLVIESNHDTALAWEVSPDQATWREHLNNEAAAEALVKIKRGSTSAAALKHVFLAHISERHNRPNTLVSRIAAGMRKKNISACDLELTYRTKRTPVKEIV